MSKFLPAMMWAILILGLALGARLGWVDQGTARTLLMILPAIAFVTLLPNRGSCVRHGGA